MWTRELHDELNHKQHEPTKIFYNIQSTLKFVNDEACRHTKHMVAKIHFVKDKISNGTIKADYVETSKQKTDFLTKSSRKESFMRNNNHRKHTIKKVARRNKVRGRMTHNENVLITNTILSPFSSLLFLN
jgi:hypothetical protein